MLQTQSKHNQVRDKDEQNCWLLLVEYRGVRMDAPMPSFFSASTNNAGLESRWKGGKTIHQSGRKNSPSIWREKPLHLTAFRHRGEGKQDLTIDFLQERKSTG